MMPLPKGSSIITRSRLAITTRAMPTIFFFFMASRMTEGLLADPVFGGEVVGCVAVAVVDRGLGYELLDVNGVRAFMSRITQFEGPSLDIIDGSPCRPARLVPCRTRMPSCSRPSMTSLRCRYAPSLTAAARAGLRIDAAGTGEWAPPGPNQRIRSEESRRFLATG